MRTERSRLLILMLVAGMLLGAMPLAAAAAPAAEAEVYWIFLAPRPPQSEAAVEADHAVSSRALARLERVGWQPQECDRPLDAGYLAQLRALGVHPRVRSRWLHAVSAPLTPELRAAVRTLSCVRATRPVGKVRAPLSPAMQEVRREIERSGGEDLLPFGAEARSAPQGMPTSEGRATGIQGLPTDYGDSFGQLAMLGVPELHAAGLSGSGLLIAILDSGFHKGHPAFDSLEIVAEHDFVDDDDQTQNWDGQSGWGDFHGTMTLSALGGFVPGELIGPAYRAAFALGRTEDVDDEYRAEEDFYVAGVEWADALGANLVSTSLGYRCFDDDFCYEIEELDGWTGTTSRGVSRLAAERGMLVITSAGNEGPEPSTLNTPGDADSCIAVGAVYPWGEVTGFSSRGPTGDGRIKPDVSAQGDRVVCGRWRVVDTVIDAAGSGTSLAAPLIAGLAALLLEGEAVVAPIDLIHLLREIGDRADSPDNSYGYGIPWGPAAWEDRFELVVVDSLRWSRHPVGGDSASLEIRLRNRGALSSVCGTVRPASPARGLAISDEIYDLPALAGDAGLWVGPWQTVFGDPYVSDGWGGVTLALEFGKTTAYRWVPFAIDLPELPLLWFPLEVSPHPWIGEVPLTINLLRPSDGYARLDLFDISGRLITRVEERRWFPRGLHTLTIDPADLRRIPTGRYILRLTGDAGLACRPLIRIR